MKRLLLFVIFTTSFISSIFCLPALFEVVTQQTLTPFYLLKISIKAVPEDVHFIKASITISDDTEEIEHISHYPILKTVTGDAYFLMKMNQSRSISTKCWISSFTLRNIYLIPVRLCFFFDNLLELYRTNPMLANVILVSLDDLSSIGRQIIPFEGLNSMRYTSEAFLKELEGKLLFRKGTYLPNKDLLALNESERYYDKMILITSHIEDAQETLDKAIKLSKLFNPKALFGNITNQGAVFRSELLSLPFVQFYGQRAFSLFMQKIGESSDEPLHHMNDGFITVWSEQLRDHPNEIKDENVFEIKNVDHIQIRDHPQVLEILEDFI